MHPFRPILSSSFPFSQRPKKKNPSFDLQITYLPRLISPFSCLCSVLGLAGSPGL
uniref:Uncharacterized protein n=1 Tax=Arundo donax TaxID=35708 RepID=A0A0A9GMA4_ARUDO